MASTGIRVIITGEFDSTMTYKAIVQGAASVGVPTEAANSIAAGAEVALGAKAFTTPETKCCPKVLVESTAVSYTHLLINTIERNLLPDGKWEMIENKRRINEKTPSSCTRTVSYTHLTSLKESDSL